MINLQFMLEMRKLEENDESYFTEEYNVWLSDEPLTNDEICRLMRGVERGRKLEGKPPLVQFLPRSKHTKKTPKRAEGVHSTRKVNGSPTPASGVKSTVPEDAHAEEEKTQDRDRGWYSNRADQPGRTQAAGEAGHEEVRKAAATFNAPVLAISI